MLPGDELHTLFALRGELHLRIAGEFYALLLFVEPEIFLMNGIRHFLTIDLQFAWRESVSYTHLTLPTSDLV